MDDKYLENLQGALDAGLEVGAYVFSQAITKEEAVEEAAYLMNTVMDYGITLPLVLDYEYYSGSGGLSGRLYEANLSKAEATAVCNAFCETISAYGYTAMVYANAGMLGNHLNASEIKGKIWMANYAKQTYYEEDYEYWQFTSAGGVAGISGNVDLNFWFQPAGTNLEPNYGTLPFLDVGKSDWCYDSVWYVYANGIVKGITATTFEPESLTTRAQLATMLYRLEGEPAVTGTTTFRDLTAAWYKTAVAWAQSSGIVKGISETEFAPDGNITREQIVCMFYRTAGSPKVSGQITGYTDGGSVSSWAKDAMIWALQNKLIQGKTSTVLAPGENATRAQVATFLTRYAGL